MLKSADRSLSLFSELESVDEIGKVIEVNEERAKEPTLNVASVIGLQKILNLDPKSLNCRREDYVRRR